MKKLYYLVNTRIPSEKAHTRQIFEMANAFSNLFELTLLTIKRKQDNINLRGIDYSKFYLIKKIKIKYLLGIDDVLFKRNKSLRKIINFINLFFYIINFLLLKRFNFLFSREWQASILFALIRPEKIIYEMHQFDNYQLSKKSFIYGIKILKIFNRYKNFSILCISDNLKNKIMPEILNHNININVYVLHDAFRKLKSSNKNINIVQKKKYHLSYFGQLFKSKGIETIIQIARNLKNIEILIVGGTDHDFKRLKESLIKKKITNIHLLGFLDPSKLSQYYLMSKILILPQIDEQAESPLKLFEYLNYRLPIVASSTPSIKEILTHKKDALLYNPGNYLEAISHVESLLNDKKLYCHIVKNCSELSKKFTWNNRSKKIYKLFNEK